jgi:hypothetical protein
VNGKKNKIGLNLNDEPSSKKEDYLENIKACINKIVDKEDLEIRYNIYPLSKNKIIISVRINKAARFVSIKDEGVIYNIKNKELNILSAREFQAIIEGEQTYLLENKVTLEIERIKSECNLA